MAKFVFINEKEREFKRLKMKQIFKFTKEMQEEMKEAKTEEETALAVGRMCAKMLEPFEAEEILDAEPDEFIIAQALQIIQPYYKGGRTKKEIENLKADLIDANTIANIQQMKLGFL